MKPTAIDVPYILKVNGLFPKKALGQNFLVDQGALKRVSNAAEIDSDSVVLEVGSGLGSLTRFLAWHARQVVAVELDQALLAISKQMLSENTNVEFVQGDILKLDPARLMPHAGYLVVSNIPYYITSALIRHLLESDKKPSRLVLTIQKEVADRLCAVPDDMNLLALSVQVFGAPRIVGLIPAASFYPKPDVDSNIIRVDLFAEPAIKSEYLDLFFTLTKAGFSQKRKMVRNSLSAAMRWNPETTNHLLESAGIDPQRRAETIFLEEWGLLVEKVGEFDPALLSRN